MARTATPATAPLLLSLDAVCDLLQVSRPTVLRLVSAGHLPKPSCTVGIQRRWRRQDIDRFINGGLR